MSFLVGIFIGLLLFSPHTPEKKCIEWVTHPQKTVVSENYQMMGKDTFMFLASTTLPRIECVKYK